MPIPVVQFQQQTPEQISPLMGAIPAYQQAYMNQLRIANQRMQNQYYPQMQQEDLNKMRIQNQYLPQMQQAQIDSMKAMANYRNMGGANMGVGQQQLMGLRKQIGQENPTANPDQVEAIMNAYLNGDETLPDGSPLPEASGVDRSMLSQIFKRNTTAGLQNMAASLDVTAEEINKIPIDSIVAFSGVKGRKRYYEELAKQQTDPDSVSPEFRQYQAFIKAIRYLDMDGIRKALGTSIVPDYVMATIGNILDPTNNLWNDEKQSRIQLEAIRDWVNSTAQAYGKKARFGNAIRAGDSKKPLNVNSPAVKAITQSQEQKKIKASDGNYYTEDEIDRMLKEGG